MRKRVTQKINKDTTTDIVLMLLLVVAVSILSYLEFTTS
jgi:hypothetical protein